jgi:hypothetical protein
VDILSQIIEAKQVKNLLSSPVLLFIDKSSLNSYNTLTISALFRDEKASPLQFQNSRRHNFLSIKKIQGVKNYYEKSKNCCYWFGVVW